MFVFRAWGVSLHGVGASTGVMVPEIWTLEDWSSKHLFTPLLVSDPFLLTVYRTQVVDRSCSPTKETPCQGEFVHNPVGFLHARSLLYLETKQFVESNNMFTLMIIYRNHSFRAKSHNQLISLHVWRISLALWKRNVSPPYHQDHQRFPNGSSHIKIRLMDTIPRQLFSPNLLQQLAGYNLFIDGGDLIVVIKINSWQLFDVFE